MSKGVVLQGLSQETEHHQHSCIIQFEFVFELHPSCCLLTQI